MKSADIILNDDERIDEINERLCLIQKKKGLTFGTDAYLLSAFAKPMKNCTAYDLGTGTGVASLLCLAKNKYKKIYGVEIQHSFAELSKRNAELNRFETQFEIIEDDIRNASTFPFSGNVGCVISNPPYMPLNSGKAPCNNEMSIARREENGTIYDFCRSAGILLKHGGLFYTVFRPDRLAELIYSLKSNSLEPKKIVIIYPYIESPPCLVLVESKKGASPSLKMSRSLIIYSKNDDLKQKKYTEDMERIYSEFTLDFLFK